MADKVEKGIEKWILDKGPVTVPPGEIAKRAGIEGATKHAVEQALDSLRRKRVLTTSMNHQTRKMTLRPVRVNA